MKHWLIIAVVFVMIAITLLLCIVYTQKTNTNISNIIIDKELNIVSSNIKKIETVYLKINKNREGNRKVIDIILKLPLSTMNLADYCKLDDEVSKLTIERIQIDPSFKCIHDLIKMDNIIILKKDSDFSSFPIIVIYNNYVYWIYKTYYL